MKEKLVTWDELEAAVMEEYRDLGAPVKGLGDFRFPHGDHLFPRAVTRGEGLPYPDDELLVIMKEDVRDEAQSRLGRGLTDREFTAVLAKFKDALDCMDWTFYLEEALRIFPKTGPDVEKQIPCRSRRIVNGVN